MCALGNRGRLCRDSGHLWDEGNLKGVGVLGMENGLSKVTLVRCISDILEPCKGGRAIKYSYKQQLLEFTRGQSSWNHLRKL